jgi:hypothetical protein
MRFFKIGIYLKCVEKFRKIAFSLKNRLHLLVFNNLFVNYFAGNKNVLIFASRFKKNGDSLST